MNIPGVSAVMAMRPAIPCPCSITVTLSAFLFLNSREANVFTEDVLEQLDIYGPLDRLDGNQ